LQYGFLFFWKHWQSARANFYFTPALRCCKLTIPGSCTVWGLVEVSMPCRWALVRQGKREVEFWRTFEGISSWSSLFYLGLISMWICFHWNSKYNLICETCNEWN
jgi:hypothetical protein